ncbi:MAG: hypothetical protein Q7R47_03180 [Candidatus Diapherotrites archaeon]|nr:hypothetical protein [Candidatus Diapherotrites archaeon]
MKLVLFDVEGVLLQSDGEGMRSLDAVNGIKEYLALLQKDGHVVGVLTAQTAQELGDQLTKAEVEEAFKFGVFGDGSRVTQEMVKSAVREAAKYSPVSFGKRDVYWVVASARNVRVAKELGLRAIAVATGSERVEQLANAGADFLFSDFSHVKSMVLAVEPHIY